MDYKSYFKGKKITLMGLGLLGRGVGDALFLAECGAKLTITDLKTEEELKESLDKLKIFTDIKYVLGKHDLEDFKNQDMILKAAGVPLDSPYIEEARKNNIPVEMSASLFARLVNIPIIGVTGTRGKTTVTELIAHILKTAGKKILLGGNIRGVSNFELFNKVSEAEVCVMELDSWQLQGFGKGNLPAMPAHAGQAGISPHIAVFTTFFPDHMTYYGGDMEKYFRDKENIFKYQNENDVLVAGSQMMPFIKKWSHVTKNTVVPEVSLPVGWSISIPGEHNEYNAMIAVEACRKFGIKDEVIKPSLASFTGVPGRLQLVAEVNGVKYYNDTTATTPEATVAALKALGDKNKLIIILGGSDKSLDMSALLMAIPQYSKSAVLLKGTGTEKIKKGLPQSTEVESMQEAVEKAKALAESGGTVLLSPGFASFGMFKNEYDRGDQFMNIVKNLK